MKTQFRQVHTCAMKPRVRSIWLTHSIDQMLLPVRLLKFF